MSPRAIAAVLLLIVACGGDPPKETATASQTATAPAIDSPPALNQMEPETAAPQAEPTDAVKPTTTAAPKVVLSQLQQEERKSVLACEDKSDCVLHKPCCSCGGRQAMNVETAAASIRESCKHRSCRVCTEPAPPQQDIVAVCEAGLCVSKPSSASK